jgi:hypothetical protein
VVEIIPRRPDRPADPLAFQFPLDGELHLLRGFGVTLGETAADSPASVEIAAERGAPVRVLALAGQTGKTRVAATGRLVGNTVVTAHAVAGPDATRTYLLVHGKLESFGPDVEAGAELEAGATLGFAGDSGNPGVVSLYLEARQVRDGIDLQGAELRGLVASATSVATDLRNVLPSP